MRSLNGRVAKLEQAMKPNLAQIASRTSLILRRHAAGLLPPEKETAVKRLLELLEIARKRGDQNE